MDPLLSLFRECPVVLLCLSARMSCCQEECFPDGGEEVSLDLWTFVARLAAVACESWGPFEGLAAACLDMCSSDHEISCQVICCEIHYEKHPETDA